jgi:hypothetical protein
MIRAAALVLAGVAALIGLAQLATYGLLIPNAADWWSYHEGAERLIATGSPYSAMQGAPYLLHEAAWGRGFVYPPLAGLLFLPTLLGGWTFYALDAAGVVGFVTISVLIARREGLALGGVLVVGALALAHPGFQEVREGQISPLIAAAVGAMWLAPRASGWLAVLTGMVKVFPGIGMVWALRQRAPLLLPILVGLALGVATWWMWPTWATAMLNAQPGCPAWSLPSIACTTGIRWLGVAVAALLAIAVLRVKSDRLAFLLLTFAMIAPAPDLYWGYLMIPFVGFLPLGIGLVRSEGSPARRPGPLANDQPIA